MNRKEGPDVRYGQSSTPNPQEMESFMKWFKMHTTLHRNVKAQSLTAEAFRTWMNLLSIYGEEESFPSTQQILFETRLTEETYQAHLSALLECGLIDRDEKGQLVPHNWEEYNRHILSTERVHKHRASRQVKQVKQMKHVSNVSKTPPTEEPAFVDVSPVFSPVLSDSQNNANFSNGTMKHVSHVTAQATENKADSGTDLESETERNNLKQLKRSRVEEIRVEEIRKEENTLSHPYPLSPAVAGQAENGASARATFRTLLNGKTPEPSGTELDAFSQWAHDVYHQHPKRKNQYAVLHALKQNFAGKPAEQQLFDENHALWITHWQLDPAYPRFVPVLAEPNGGGWINDQAWRHKPPPPPDTRTKNQITNDAVAQNYLAELRKGKSQ